MKKNLMVLALVVAGSVFGNIDAAQHPGEPVSGDASQHKAADVSVSSRSVASRDSVRSDVSNVSNVDSVDSEVTEGAKDGFAKRTLSFFNNHKITTGLTVASLGFGFYSLSDAKVRSIAWTLISGTDEEKEEANKEIDACEDGSLGRKVMFAKLALASFVLAGGNEAICRIYAKISAKSADAPEKLEEVELAAREKLLEEEAAESRELAKGLAKELAEK
jgi:hypothetical protein